MRSSVRFELTFIPAVQIPSQIQNEPKPGWLLEDGAPPVTGSVPLVGPTHFPISVI